MATITPTTAFESLQTKVSGLRSERNALREKQQQLMASGDILSAKDRARLSLLDTELAEYQQAEMALRRKADAYEEQLQREADIQTFCDAGQMLQSLLAQLRNSLAEFSSETSELFEQMRLALEQQQPNFQMFGVTTSVQQELRLVAGAVMVEWCKAVGLSIQEVRGPAGQLKQYPDALSEVQWRSYCVSPRMAAVGVGNGA